MDDITIRAILEELAALKNAIRAGDFNLALELVRKNDVPFLWSKDGKWLGGKEEVIWKPRPRRPRWLRYCPTCDKVVEPFEDDPGESILQCPECLECL